MLKKGVGGVKVSVGALSTEQLDSELPRMAGACSESGGEGLMGGDGEACEPTLPHIAWQGPGLIAGAGETY